MAVKRILQAHEEAVRQKAKRVRDFGPSLEALVEDMIETIRSAPGLGLAAPQIGVPLRIIVVELPEDEEPQSKRLYVICNPEIVRSWGQEESEEGCLSLPGYVGEIKRASTVTVKGRDLKGRKIKVKAQGLLARALQHEIDHLEGMLFTDRLESIDKLRPLKRREEGKELPI